MDWIRNRGGVAVWNSQDLSDPGKSWSTPANAKDGTPTRRPHWAAGERPDEIHTDPGQIQVNHDREVKRFRIAIARGGGFKMYLTSASSRKVRAAVEKAGIGAHHVFDGDEAVIMAPSKTETLAEWANSNGYTVRDPDGVIAAHQAKQKYWPKDK